MIFSWCVVSMANVAAAQTTQTGTITGAVVGASRLSADRGRDGVWRFTAMTHPAGTFQLNGLPPGSVTLVGPRKSSGIDLGLLDGGAPRRLTAADSSGAFVKPDRVVVIQQGALVARRLDVAPGY